ncbi:DUF1214 domain-containing protein [Streptomyces sp. NPDC093060]|uniref:DUF1214 domain-containing protein n=1 Tax=Streptomyces sp. NPDC093060 TaxID=3366019 RepID=UPI003806D0BA
MQFGDDFLRRAAEQSFVGVAVNDPEEAVYLAAFHDADGSKLSTSRYELRFGSGNLPPVDAFWSLAAYGEDRNFGAVGNGLGPHPRPWALCAGASAERPAPPR